MIPREGVESDDVLVHDVCREHVPVIPREGVESVLLVPALEGVVLVIPREGVESVVNYYITLRVGTHCDPERGS